MRGRTIAALAALSMFGCGPTGNDGSSDGNSHPGGTGGTATAGTPGDVVSVRGRQVVLNGTVLDEPYVRRVESAPGNAGDTTFCGYAYGCDPTTVPPDSYFVMGDRRDNSQDSRYWGFVKREKIKGKAIVIYWSWDSDQHWLRQWRIGRSIS